MNPRKRALRKVALQLNEDLVKRVKELETQLEESLLTENKECGECATKDKKIIKLLDKVAKLEKKLEKEGEEKTKRGRKKKSK